MQMKRRSALIALAGWLALVIGVFAYAMLANESESASPTGPDPKVSRSTVPRTTERNDVTSLIVESEPAPQEEEAEVLGEVQLPFTGFSLFKVAPKGFTLPPFVLPQFAAAYVPPGFVFVEPDLPPSTTVPQHPTAPPTTVRPTTTVPPTTAPPTTVPPTTAPPTTVPPTTAPPTTVPPTTEPPTTVPPTTEPPVTAPPTTEPPPPPPPPPDTLPPDPAPGF